MKPQIEIEIKAKLKNKEFIEKKLKELGAQYIGKKHQIDYYFSPPHRSYVGKGLYFRIRHDKLSGKSRMEYHAAKMGEHYVGEEYEIEVSDYKMALKILDLLEFKPELAIDKIRNSYKLGDVTIDLDTLKELGSFIEIEILNKNPKEVVRKIKALATTLGISEKDIMHQNYFNQMYELRKGLTL